MSHPRGIIDGLLRSRSRAAVVGREWRACCRRHFAQTNDVHGERAGTHLGARRPEKEKD